MICCSNNLAFPWEVYLGGMDMHHMAEIDWWCNHTFGPQGKAWSASDRGWQMRTHEDAILIELAWGSVRLSDA